MRRNNKIQRPIYLRRIQVVGNTEKSVFDDEVRQLLVVPQNFSIVKKAGSEGLEYISFKVLRAIFEEVLMNSYQDLGLVGDNMLRNLI